MGLGQIARAVKRIFDRVDGGLVDAAIQHPLMIKRRIGAAVKDLLLPLLALRQIDGRRPIGRVLPPASHAKMIGMHMREHDFLDVVWR